jgi:glutathione S-transferase
MSRLHLIIGNKNYSSWSLRVWIAMTMAGLSFTETVIALDQPGTKARIAEYSGAGRVPVLKHGKLVVWESLAILEYLAEAFPEKHLWPKTIAARAMARSAANEMHGGFVALRDACPMNLRRPRRAVKMTDAVHADCRRIEQLWRGCRKNHGKGGPFLFGKFSIADAMFAPVVTRFDTYRLPAAADTKRYIKAILSLPAFRSWKEAALQETWIIPHDEVD